MPAALEQLLVSGAFLALSVIVAHLGTAVLAAHRVAFNALSLAFLPGIGFGVAATALVGQSVGARRLVRRVRARQINAEESALDLAHQVAARFPNKPSVAQVQFVTTQEARWGSYSSATRTIRLNAALRHMPRWVLEAVVAHELAHVTHHDHGPGFWKLLRSVEPAVDRADAFLAGVTWLGHRWEGLPPVERALLTRVQGYIDDTGDQGRTD